MNYTEDRQIRKYTIRGEGEHFVTGVTSVGTQLLIGVKLPNIVAIVFSTTGDIIDTVVQPLNTMVATTVRGALRKALKGQNALKSPISIKSFAIPDRYIAIKDVPPHLQEVIDHPECFDDERKDQLQNALSQWMADGHFVLEWDEEYYFNKHGDLEST